MDESRENEGCKMAFVRCNVLSSKWCIVNYFEEMNTVALSNSDNDNGSIDGVKIESDWNTKYAKILNSTVACCVYVYMFLARDPFGLCRARPFTPFKTIN